MPENQTQVIRDLVTDYVDTHRQPVDGGIELSFDEGVNKYGYGPLLGFMANKGTPRWFYLPPEVGQEPGELSDKHIAPIGQTMLQDAFLGRLRQVGLIKFTVYDAWRFAPGTIRHILIGQNSKGCHHLPSTLGLDVEERVISSKVNLSDEQQGHNGAAKQRVQANGVYHCDAVTIDGKSKRSGSTMFPDEWSAGEVLAAILAVQCIVPVEVANGRKVHQGEHRGVNIRVVVDQATDKIIAGYPAIKR